jgi:hypothetical protein
MSRGADDDVLFVPGLAESVGHSFEARHIASPHRGIRWRALVSAGVLACRIQTGREHAAALLARWNLGPCPASYRHLNSVSDHGGRESSTHP